VAGVWEAIGWPGLSPAEQYSAFAGAVLGLVGGVGLMVTLRSLARALFGGLFLNRRSKKRRKARKGRRR